MEALTTAVTTAVDYTVFIQGFALMAIAIIPLLIANAGIKYLVKTVKGKEEKQVQSWGLTQQNFDKYR